MNKLHCQHSLYLHPFRVCTQGRVNRSSEEASASELHTLSGVSTVQGWETPIRPMDSSRKLTLKVLNF